MNKTRIKQIYLLTIIVSGIIALSVYSTYAIFTLESETSDIVSIHTPHTLNISSSIDEYKQISIPANSYITTDIDIYNNFNYDVCYSAWYKIVSNKSIDKTKVKIYQNTNESLTTTSTIKSVNSERITLLITNDNNSDAKVNIGLSYSENTETCELNISKDKSLITKTINNIENLSDTLTKRIYIKNNQEGYLVYKDKTEAISLLNDKVYISDKYTYKNEIFSLTEPKEILPEEINKYTSSEITKYYTCLNSKECHHMYQINEIKLEDNIYKITKYDILEGYLEGNSGLRKVNQDYYYFGDNPSNFIYYNCTNELDSKTCELWRIVGFTYDTETNKYLTKIVNNDYINQMEYNSNNNTWNDSTISKYLNKYKLNNNYTQKEITFKTENLINLDTDINYLTDNNKTSITLLKLSDYLNTSICQNTKISDYNSDCLNNNWLNKNSTTNEWTMTIKHEEPYKDSETDEIITPENNNVYSIGNNISLNNINEKLNIRPVIYLSSRTFLVSGDGTLDNPYIIK